VRSAIFLAFEVETGNRAKDFQPGGRVAANLDLRLDGSERVESLIEQIAHDAGLRLVAGGADVADGEVVVDAHVALDEARHLPLVGGAVVTLENEDVAATCGATVRGATTLVIGVRERGADARAERGGIACLGRADAISQTSLFHAASPRTA